MICSETVGASLTIRQSVKMTSEQQDAIALAAKALPAAWRLFVYADTAVGSQPQRFTVRIVGPGFTAISAFGPGTRTEQLAAFIERIRREHTEEP
jgi:hypothetical protein